MTSVWLDGAPDIGSDPFPAGTANDIVVVGAGLAGLVTAVLLTRAGRQVVVLERRSVGAVTTGNTTGKLTLLQGAQLSMILRSHGSAVAAAYVEGNRTAQDWILDYCSGHGVRFDRRDAWTYAVSESGLGKVEQEFDAARQLGLPISREPATELPYEVKDAIRLPDQAQLYPMELLTALARELRELGGVLVQDCRVEGMDIDQRVSVRTQLGDTTANRVVLAAGLPFLDRGLYFAKLMPQRSYALAFRGVDARPQGMYLSVDKVTRSLRTATHDGQELLIVGGNGHDVGRPPKPPSELVQDLVRWTERHFPGAVQTHTWSAQDYRSPSGVPFVGRLSRGGGKVYLATGFSKWGMTNAPMAAMMIAGQILGDRPGWARRLGHRVSRPRVAASVLGFVTKIGSYATTGWLGAEVRQLHDDSPAPAEGEGIVGARRGRPVAISTVDGQTCELQAVCTHLGGIVAWNDLERSWDCPLHGSRFAADGTVLEGPATSPLPRLTPEPAQPADVSGQ